MDRREFHQLALGAVSGLLAGTVAGCGGSEAPKKGTTGTGSGGKEAGDKTQVAQAKDVHICRGLNACQGKGADGKNGCAGQGTCATAAPHTCHAMNECKGQGGCGSSFGQNECKGKGECGVPLMEGTWAKAREAFEKKMKEAGQKIGEAPAKM